MKSSTLVLPEGVRAQAGGMAIPPQGRPGIPGSRERWQRSSQTNGRVAKSCVIMEAGAVHKVDLLAVFRPRSQAVYASGSGFR